MAKLNLLKSFEQGLKKTVGIIGYEFAGGKYGTKMNKNLAKTTEGQKFLEDYEKSFVGKLRRKIWNWSQSK